jgi:putative ABC transport system ATP-binding protein
MTHALSLHDVRKSYRTGRAEVSALAGLSLDVAAGSFTAVMGPSGSGKTTLLLCAAGLERPDSGTVRLGDVDLAKLPEEGLTALRRDRIGFIFQAFNLLPSLTAAQNVGLPLRLAGRKPDEATVLAGLTAVGLGERAQHRPAELSGGQQQRVAIARALVTKPQVLFADEPTGALDSHSGQEVLVLLRGLVQEHGGTVVMVTHDPVAAAYADRVVFLADGRLAGTLDRPDANAVARWLSTRGQERSSV